MRISIAFALLPIFSTLAAEFSTSPRLRINTEMHSEAIVGPAAVEIERNYFLTISYDGTAKVWRLSDGNLLKTLRPPLDIDNSKNKVRCSTLLKKSPQALIVTTTGNTFLFDVLTGKLLRTVTENSAFNQISVTEDDSVITAIPPSSEGVWLLNMSDGSIIEKIVNPGEKVQSFSYDTKGRLAVASYKDSKSIIRLYDSRRNEVASETLENTPIPRQLSFSPDSSKLAIGFKPSPGRLEILDGNTLKQKFSPDLKTLRPTDYLSCVEWSLDGNLLFAAGLHMLPSWGYAARHACVWDKQGFGNLSKVEASKDDTMGICDTPIGTLFTGYTPDFRMISKSGKVLYARSGEMATIWGNRPETLRIDRTSSIISVISSVGSITFRTKDRCFDTNLVEFTQLSNTEGLQVNVKRGETPKVNGIPVSGIQQTMPIYGYAVSPDKSMVIFAAGYQVIAANNKAEILWKVPSADATRIAFPEIGNTFICLSGSGLINWHDKSSGRVKMSLFFHSDRLRWIMYTPEGYFDCSSGAENLIGWSINKGSSQEADFFPAAQFWNSYYRPDLITSVLNGQEIENKVPPSTENIPKVTLDISESVNQDTGTLGLILKATPGKNGLGMLNIRQNGRTIDEGARGLQIVQSEGNRRYSIQLLQGENILEGIAFDRENSVYGISQPIRLNWSPKVVTRPNMRILSVGVGSYNDLNLRLISPAKDASAICGVFSNTSRSIYGEIFPTLITDSQATRKNLRKSLDNLTLASKPSDTVIIFLAGHGYAQNDNYYFLPVDADITDLDATCLTIGALGEFVKQLPANRVAIFLDTCQSGSAIKSLGAIAMARSIDERRMLATLAKSRGVAIFSAASASQAAFEIKALEHGVFTWCLLDALNNHREDISLGGQITITRLLGKVNLTTRETSFKYLQVEQSPVVYIFGDDFLIGKN